MSSESWKTFFEIGAVILLGLTFLDGWAVWFFSQKVNAEQAAQLREFDTKLTDAKREISDQQLRAAQLEKDAAELTAKNLDLEARLAWRRITPKEHNLLVSILKPHAGASVVILKLGDMEAGVFADDLIKTFRDSGWLVTENFAGMMAPPPYGLQCSIDQDLAAGQALVIAAKSLPNVQINSATSPPVARILVGLKPPP